MYIFYIMGTLRTSCLKCQPSSERNDFIHLLPSSFSKQVNASVYRLLEFTNSHVLLKYLVSKIFLNMLKCYRKVFNTFNSS